MQSRHLLHLQASILLFKFWQRRWPHIVLALMALALLFALASQPVWARQQPSRTDRRPDRETRIRYPRISPQSGTRQNTPLRSAPATPPPIATSQPAATSQAAE